MFLGNKLVKAFCIFIAFFSFSAFALDDAVNTGRFNNIAIDGYDSVSYFTENKAIEGNEDYQTKWHGAVWYFSSEQNKALFVADPTKYAPQYGGWCAYAMASEGDTYRIDPDVFDIKDGKLYLNYSKGVQKKWHDKQIEYITDADKFYPVSTDVKSFE